MSAFDSTLRTVLVSVIAPIVVLFLLWMLLKVHFNSLKKRLSAYILNRMIGSVNSKLNDDKEQLFSALWRLRSEPDKKGDAPDLRLLEIGAGGGANFKYYPRGVSFMCVEPNAHFRSHLEKNISQFPHLKLEQFIVAKGEDMKQVPDNYCDAVVITLVLCSLDADVIGKLLKEVKRVLRPGGMLFYLEHIAAPESSWVLGLQNWLNPVWRICGDGCHLNRDTWRTIEQAGFAEIEYRRFSANTWFLPLKFLLLGTATK